MKPEEPEAKKSLATVLRKRRQEVQELVAAGAPVTLDPAVLFTQAQQLAGDVWTDKQRKECDRQDKVLRVRQLEAAAQHHLLDHESAGDIEQQVQLFFAAEDTNHAARERLEDRMACRLARPEIDLYGQSVLCTPGLFTQAEESSISA